MKKIIILSTIIIVSLVILVITNDKPAKTNTHIPKPPVKTVPAPVKHGLPQSYLDCSPKQPTTRLTKLQQAEIANTQHEMAKFNDVPNNTDIPELQQLNALYKQETSRIRYL
jgi:hypothetical protein